MKTLYTTQIISALLIFLFTYTASSKLAGFSFFQAQLSLYPFIKDAAAPIAIAIPAVELAMVVLLFLPATRLMGLYASSLLLIVFTVYLSVMVATQKNLPCSCGGVIQKMSWQQHIAFNLFFILLCALGIRLQRKAGKEMPSAEGRVESTHIAGIG